GDAEWQQTRRVRAMGRWMAAAAASWRYGPTDGRGSRYVRAASTASRMTRHPLPPRDTPGDGAEAAPCEGSVASMGLRWRCSCVGTTRIDGGNAGQGNRQPRPAVGVRRRR
ncbi:hypothetical protein PVAP13_5KG763250, partial [Panicum virgatum]